jgi:putative Mg2+ transporter-C (MgtC) family protein
MSDALVVTRLLVIATLAGLIGFERERHGRAAGLRTHMLVGVGSCLMMLTALHVMESLAGRVEVDPTRMGAQVVSGIGFLGAGTIMRFRASVRGLTTAASLWAVCGIGLAVGAGFLVGAVAGTSIVLVVLFALGRLERAIRNDWFRMLVIDSKAGSEDLAQIRRVLGEFDVEIRDFEITRPEGAETSMIEFDLRLVSERDEAAILADVLRLSGTRRAHWA